MKNEASSARVELSVPNNGIRQCHAYNRTVTASPRSGYPSMGKAGMKYKAIDRTMIAVPIVVWLSVFAYGAITNGPMATVVIASSALALAAFSVVMFVRMLIDM